MTKPKIVEVRKKKLEEREPPSEKDFEFVETCEPPLKVVKKRGKKPADSCS